MVVCNEMALFFKVIFTAVDHRVVMSEKIKGLKDLCSTISSTSAVIDVEWITYLVQFGYIGVFLISLISALTIIFPIPYTLVLYALGSSLDPVLLAIASGLGSALGEVSGYILGYYGRAIVSEQMKRRMEYMLKIFDRFGVVAIFLFALTPLPDDLLFIPLGMMRYSLVKALIPTVIGKVLMSFIIAYSGQVSFEFIQILFGESGGVITIVISSILLISVLLLMYKIDWEAVFHKYIMPLTNEDPDEGVTECSGN
jgi:membrane protein YqaA with SNARE-associated domain